MMLVMFNALNTLTSTTTTAQLLFGNYRIGTLSAGNYQMKK